MSSHQGMVCVITRYVPGRRARDGRVPPAAAAEQRGVVRMKVEVLRDPNDIEELEDMGPVDDMIEGESIESGIVMNEGPGEHSECGLWVCTPGYWEWTFESDEFCHWMEGRATFTHESGEQPEIEPGTVTFFPAGWTGTCRVYETLRKVYMIR